MTQINLTTATLIPTQERLKQCTGRRIVGVINKKGSVGYDYNVKYDAGKQIIETRGRFRKE